MAMSDRRGPSAAPGDPPGAFSARPGRSVPAVASHLRGAARVSCDAPGSGVAPALDEVGVAYAEPEVFQAHELPKRPETAAA